MEIPLGMEHIDELLGLEAGQVSLILRPLHSVLTLSSELDMVEFHHASFRDFLDSQERSSIFFVGSPEHRAKFAREILKALAYKYEDRQKNRTDHGVHWTITRQWISNLTSVAPSADFVPLLRMVNLDFACCCVDDVDTNMKELLVWLKKIRPIPEDLLQRWTDWHFSQSQEYFQIGAREHLLYTGTDDYPDRTEAQILTPSLHIIRVLHTRMNGEIQNLLASCGEVLTGGEQCPLGTSYLRGIP
ncbi:hypothetical protein K438DRAFT_972553 [Mycena galopus ATCC 62051]|nr:hypothetical protein K438DRAFT_972553 [Mycena galopus ATCC 62051]